MTHRLLWQHTTVYHCGQQIRLQVCPQQCQYICNVKMIYGCLNLLQVCHSTLLSNCRSKLFYLVLPIQMTGVSLDKQHKERRYLGSLFRKNYHLHIQPHRAMKRSHWSLSGHPLKWNLGHVEDRRNLMVLQRNRRTLHQPCLKCIFKGELCMR